MSDRCEVCDRLFTEHKDQPDSIVQIDGSEFGYGYVCGGCMGSMEDTMYQTQYECTQEELQMAKQVMVVLVFGGRNYQSAAQMESVLNAVGADNIALLVHGDARGADRMSGQWAVRHGVHCARIPALWDHFGYKAGNKRNSAMLALNITHAVKFPGGSGTAHMLKLCKDKGIPVWEVE